MAALSKAEDRSRRGFGVVGKHRVGIQERRRAVDEHECDAGIALACEIAVIGAGSWHVDLAVDRARALGERKFSLQL
jgi:hypothetical protein